VKLLKVRFADLGEIFPEMLGVILAEEQHYFRYEPRPVKTDKHRISTEHIT